MKVLTLVMFQLLIGSLCCGFVVGQEGCQRDGLVEVVRSIQEGGVLGSHLAVGHGIHLNEGMKSRNIFLYSN